ncbi:MAG: prepilin peptidase [Candidatus Neomarinimicrobiota bacterium]|nr:MAG: prepilin peptidase [Candidatus Neomarinimicrobiota bacterium]
MSPDPFLVGSAGVLGLIIGSFLNVVILRLPAGESIVSPPSHCPHCGTAIRWWQNIPVLSYLVLRGKCARCGAPISWQYPLVEAGTGLLFGWTAFFYGLSWNTISTWLLIAYLIPIALIDYRHFLIFDVLSLSGIVLGLGLSLLPGASLPLPGAALGGLIGGGALYAIRGLGFLAFRKEAMGLGDVKLATLLGVFLGWKLTLLSFFTGAVLIVVTYLVRALLTRTPQPEEKYAFGFYFSLAALLMRFWGNNLLDYYLNFIQ